VKILLEVSLLPHQRGFSLLRGLNLEGRLRLVLKVQLVPEIGGVEWDLHSILRI